MILHFYARAENCISDHKPVKAFFTVLTKIVDGASREETLLAALPAWQHSVVENRATSPPGSYFVEVSPLYVDDKNIKWGVNREFSLRMTSKLKSSSAVSIPVQLLLSTVPAWIDVLSTTGVSQDGEMMSFAIGASTPLRLTFSVNYQNAMRYISDTTGQDQGAPPVTSSGTCAGTTGGMSVELCATLTFAFQGHSYHDSSGDCIVIPVCFSFEWYGDENTPFRGTDLQFLD
ncbi:unnamed protein product [Symbiodinium microadriaticum]|nr:unnamed protein product [Symbiodinium microadriaticum]